MRLPNTTDENRTGKNRCRKLLLMQCTAQIHPRGRHTFRSPNLEIAIVVPDASASMRWSAYVIDGSAPNGRKYLRLGKFGIWPSMRILEAEVKVVGARDTDQARSRHTSPIPSLWEKGQGQQGTQTEGKK